MTTACLLVVEFGVWAGGGVAVVWGFVGKHSCASGASPIGIGNVLGDAKGGVQVDGCGWVPEEVAGVFAGIAGGV